MKNQIKILLIALLMLIIITNNTMELRMQSEIALPMRNSLQHQQVKRFQNFWNYIVHDLNHQKQLLIQNEPDAQLYTFTKVIPNLIHYIETDIHTYCRKILTFHQGYISDEDSFHFERIAKDITLHFSQFKKKLIDLSHKEIEYKKCHENLYKTYYKHFGLDAELLKNLDTLHIAEKSIEDLKNPDSIIFLDKKKDELDNVINQQNTDIINLLYKIQTLITDQYNEINTNDIEQKINSLLLNGIYHYFNVPILKDCIAIFDKIIIYLQTKNESDIKKIEDSNRIILQISQFIYLTEQYQELIKELDTVKEKIMHNNSSRIKMGISFIHDKLHHLKKHSLNPELVNFHHGIDILLDGLIIHAYKTKNLPVLGSELLRSAINIFTPTKARQEINFIEATKIIKMYFENCKTNHNIQNQENNFLETPKNTLFHINNQIKKMLKFSLERD